MSETGQELTCLNCGMSENQVPLVTLRYRGQPAWVCSHCLPMLIHRPERMKGKLADAEKIPRGEEPE